MDTTFNLDWKKIIEKHRNEMARNLGLGRRARAFSAIYRSFSPSKCNAGSYQGASNDYHYKSSEPPATTGVASEGTASEKVHQNGDFVRDAKREFAYAEEQERNDDWECTKEYEQEYADGG